jgi:hypothetical protein
LEFVGAHGAPMLILSATNKTIISTTEDARLLPKKREINAAISAITSMLHYDTV